MTRSFPLNLSLQGLSAESSTVCFVSTLAIGVIDLLILFFHDGTTTSKSAIHTIGGRGNSKLLSWKPSSMCSLEQKESDSERSSAHADKAWRYSMLYRHSYWHPVLLHLYLERPWTSNQSQLWGTVTLRGVISPTSATSPCTLPMSPGPSEREVGFTFGRPKVLIFNICRQWTDSRVSRCLRRIAEREGTLSAASMPCRYPGSSAKHSEKLDLSEGRLGKQGHHVDERCAWSWKVGDCADRM